jgi:hypothetical protein
MSATSGICRGIAGRGSEGALKLGGADSPTVELIQSLSDMPARRAAASALSRTEGSMPSTLHDTREFMLSSGSLRRPTCAISLPARPTEETIVFPRGSPASEPTFSRYGKERVKERDGRPQKLPGRQIGCGRSDRMGAPARGARTKNIENNPMQSSASSGSQHSSRVRPGYGMVRLHGPTRSQSCSIRCFRAGRLRSARRCSGLRRK